MKQRIAAIILSFLILVIIGAQLLDLTAFTLGSPSSTFPITDWNQISEVLANWIWSYRVIDVMIQATLLLASVLGFSALFRTMKKEES